MTRRAFPFPNSVFCTRTIAAVMPIVVRNRNFFKIFSQTKSLPTHVQEPDPDVLSDSRALPMHHKSFFKVPRTCPKTSKIRENLHFRVHAPDLSLRTTCSKTHKQTRDPHRWIGLDLIYMKKLLRGQTNSRIARNLHFSHPFTPIFDSPIESEFPLPLYYSRA